MADTHTEQGDLILIRHVSAFDDSKGERLISMCIRCAARSACFRRSFYSNAIQLTTMLSSAEIIKTITWALDYRPFEIKGYDELSVPAQRCYLLIFAARGNQSSFKVDLC